MPRKQKRKKQKEKAKGLVLLLIHIPCLRYDVVFFQVHIKHVKLKFVLYVKGNIEFAA